MVFISLSISLLLFPSSLLLLTSTNRCPLSNRYVKTYWYIWQRATKEVMKNLGKYARKKKLEVEKTKMMMFNKRKMKSEENEWNWEGRKIQALYK
jgi:hypothetical protein